GQNGSSGLSYYSHLSVAGLSGGGFAITWNDTSGIGGGGTPNDVLGRVYDASGNALTETFLVNNPLDAALDSHVTALANNGFAVTWTSDPDHTFGSRNIHAQAFDAAGHTVGAEIVEPFPNNAQLPNVATLADGNLALVWSEGSGGATAHIEGQ